MLVPKGRTAATGRARMGVIERLQRLDDRLGLDSAQKRVQLEARRTALASLPHGARRSLSRRRAGVVALAGAAAIAVGLLAGLLVGFDAPAMTVVVAALFAVAMLVSNVATRRFEDQALARHGGVDVGEAEPRAVILADPDPGWPTQFEAEATRIRAALGARSEVHHVGSTAVAGLPAKPIIDIVLVVGDPADESAYVPALESIGFELRIREPDWHEHRMLGRPSGTVHLHVFGPACPEVARMLHFRDRLRTDPAAHERYATVKQQLARRDWPTVQHYADAKTEVIESILA